MERYKHIIIGGGLSGLSTAFHLGSDYLLLEKDDTVGGLCRSFKKNNFIFDITGHWLHLRNPAVRAEVLALMGNQMVSVRRESKIFSHSVLTEYPFQRNLFGMPLEIVRDCLLGAIEAHCKRIKNPKEPDNFYNFMDYHFGKGIAEHFMIPYNTKLWGVHPTAITKEWCSRFVPKPDIKEIVEGALGMNKGEMGYNVTFLYPKDTGIEALPHAYAGKLKNIITSCTVTACSLDEKWIEAKGKKFAFEHLVTTIPLPEFLKIVVNLPKEVKEAAFGLRHVPVKYFNIALRTTFPVFGCHWLYLPSKKWYFYRIGCYSNAVSHMAPKGKSSLYAELSNDVEATEDEAYANLKKLLFETSSIKSEKDILFADFKIIPYGYVIYDQTRLARLNTIFKYLKNKKVISTGRYGSWVYSSMEDAIIDGVNAANKLK